ncbi:hypothetical protein ACGFNX_26985 [Streptomyces sp. NPDC048723]|uniref:hypothetical protein n=1 Tax=Streptomyces sp. NPDC048723 TaxID=3365589 RepID=UPI00371B85F5
MGACSAAERAAAEAAAIGRMRSVWANQWARAASTKVSSGRAAGVWDAVEAACGWWEAQGSPALDRFGLTVGPDGETPWLDAPGNLLSGARWR